MAKVADLGSTAGVRAGIDAVLAPYGHQLDIFIANVGVLVAGRFAEISDPCIEEAMQINFLTHVWACRAVLPRMRGREDANIVLIGSDQGSQPDVGLFPYAQAKAALHSLTRLLAREYGPAIRVNAVAPGMSRTALVEGLILLSVLLQARATAGTSSSTGEKNAVMREVEELTCEAGAPVAAVER